MHLDHSKLVELLVEASGIEKEKVEQQLTDLVDEIHQAIKEGEAYELENFGVISGIGKNIIFIPSTELATEINYKYAGMEPLELEGASPAEEDTDKTSEAESESAEKEELEDDPFGGLLDDSDEESEKAPLESNEAKAETPDNEDAEEFDPIDELISEDESVDKEQKDREQEENDLLAELLEGSRPEPTEDEPAEQPGPDKWGIDTYKDDDAENMFSGMLGKDDSTYSDDAKSETKEEPDKEPSDLGEDTDEQKSIDKEELSIKLDTEDHLGEEETTEEDDEDFDDPFKDLLEEEEDDDDGEDEDEVVPVITNISSGTAHKEPKEKKDESKKKKKLTQPKRRKSSGASLYILVIILVLGGGIFALGYFGVVDIPGVPAQTASNQMATTPPTTSDDFNEETETSPNAPEEEQEEDVAPETVDEVQQNNEEEQTGESPVSETVDAEANPDQPLYGMNGVPVSEANNGYTIVIFSLSKESNAEAQQEKLAEAGFRVLITSQSSSQYGRLWRVSLGQFESLRDAAISAETLEKPYSENYFITKIQ